MNEFVDTIEKASSEIEKLQKLFKKSSGNQIRSKDDKDVLKAVALTWFNSHRLVIMKSMDESAFKHIDSGYQEMLSVADKSPLRQKCQNLFKSLRTNLHNLRNENISVVTRPTKSTSDTIPNFSGSVPDAEMQQILAARWDECSKCVDCGAPLAAVVMMGGLLETLLLSKANKNPTPVYTAKLAPKNHTGQTLPLKEWGLKNYIEVAHELRWITQTEKDLGAILMDYRNFIHPFKQKTYGVFLQPNDARILWELCKNISKQLI